DAEADELDGAHEEDDDDDAGPAARGGAARQRVYDDPAQQAARQERREQAEVRHQTQGRAAEADEAVHGEAEEGAKGVFRRAGGAGGTLVAQADLPEADERPQAADETHLLRQVFDHIDDFAIHEAEVAAVEGNVDVADGTEQAIEQRIARAFDETFFALGADGVNDVVAGPPGGDELIQHFGRILEVAVHDNDGPAARQFQPR